MSYKIFFQSLRVGIPVALLLSFLSFQVSAKFIAVSVSEKDNFRNLITKSIEEAVEGHGDDVYIDSANGDAQHQYEQIQQYIAAGADSIMVLPTGEYEINQRILKLAEQVPFIFINLPPVKELSTLPAKTAYVGTRDKELGTMQMEELAKLADYEGNVALLIGEKTHPAAIARTRGVKDVMAKYPKMKLVKSESANWTRNQGYSIVQKWLNDGVHFKVLVANNDEMVIGGIMAIKDSGQDVNNYLIGGIDATDDALQEMKKGTLDVTVLQDAADQGKTAVDTAYNIMENIPVDSTVWVPLRLVTPDHLDLFMKNNGE